MMAAWRNLNFAIKVSSLMVSLVLTMGAVLSVLFINSQIESLRRNVQSEGEILMETISFAIDNALYELDIAELQNIADQLTGEDEFTSLRMYDAQGRLLVDSDSTAPIFLSSPPDPVGVELVDTPQITPVFTTDSLVISQRVMIETQVVGAVSANLSLSALNTLVQTSIVQSILTSIIAIALTIIVAIFISRSVTHPIHDLSMVAQEMAKGNYTVRASSVATDEIGMLAATFNTMATEVKQRQTALEELNQSLEKRVEERTAELKLARDRALDAERTAKENSRLKSEFLSTMSHELRTPMNAIQGFVSIMLKRMGGTDYNEKSGYYLTRIEANSDRLLSIINDFLDLSRIESGRLELANLPYAPKQLVKRWQDILAVLAEEKGLAFSVEVDDNLPEKLQGDEESLSKIAINLIGNAVKFTEKGSVKVSLRRQENQMVLSVTDTGIGIPPHARELIFEEFRQIDQSTKRLYGGTGLGLSIVQKLTRLMGGTVTLQSEVDVGSTFTVSLPLGLQQPNPTEEVPNAAHS